MPAKLAHAESRSLSDQLPRWVWRDHPGNPLLAPWNGEVIADPAVLTPEETPDGRWHMYLCTNRAEILHLTSPDGLTWERRELYPWGGFSPFIIRDEGRYLIYYQQLVRRPTEVYIAGRESADLQTWSEEQEILRPTLAWETLVQKPTVRNPCLTRHGDLYLLYYSGGVRVHPELGFEEPANIGVATAASPLGPFEKRAVPLFADDPADPRRNLGAGAMKVYRFEEYDRFLGFNNGIYRCPEGHVRSALHMLVSADGLTWDDLPGNPILHPEPGGWKHALVYQTCLTRQAGEWRLYYNSRDGWQGGIERIGLAVATPEL